MSKTNTHSVKSTLLKMAENIGTDFPMTQKKKKQARMMMRY